MTSFEIKYETYSRNIAFYDEERNKVVLSPVIKKYSRLHKYLLLHESAHSIIKRHSILWLFYNLILIDYTQLMFWIINPFLVFEHCNGNKDYDKITDKKLYNQTNICKDKWLILYGHLHPNTFLGVIVNLLFFGNLIYFMFLFFGLINSVVIWFVGFLLSEVGFTLWNL